MRQASLLHLSLTLFAVGAVACSGSPSNVEGMQVANDSQNSFVTTPFGLANPTCVAEVDPSVTVSVANLPPCPTPIASVQGVEESSAPPVASEDGGSASGAAAGSAAEDGGVETDGGGASSSGTPVLANAAAAVVNGWVEYADYRATDTPGELATTWRVPDVPASNVGQTIFYFPSYEPLNGTAIVQPVLQYGVSAAGGGAYWAISSWWVGPTGAARYSSLLQVNPGDTIRGTITATNCTEGAGCKFVIVARDETIDNSRQLTIVDTVSYSWAQVGVLEVYNVTSCNQLPDNPVTFSSLVFNDQDGSPLGANWTAEYRVSNRNCPYQVGLGSSAVTLSY